MLTSRFYAWLVVPNWYNLPEELEIQMRGTFRNEKTIRTNQLTEAPTKTETVDGRTDLGGQAPGQMKRFEPHSSNLHSSIFDSSIRRTFILRFFDSSIPRFFDLRFFDSSILHSSILRFFEPSILRFVNSSILRFVEPSNLQFVNSSSFFFNFRRTPRTSRLPWPRPPPRPTPPSRRPSACRPPSRT